MPDVAGPEGLRGFRDPLPEGVDFEFDGDPFPFWEQVIECRPAIGRPPWEPFEDGPPRPPTGTASTTRRSRDDGTLDVPAPIVLCDTMPGSVGQKLGPRRGRLVRAERRLHAPRLPARAGRLAPRPPARPATPATATPASSAPSGTPRRRPHPRRLRHPGDALHLPVTSLCRILRDAREGAQTGLRPWRGSRSRRRGRRRTSC